jgi:uncharacterized protein (DUF1697 family)
MKTYIALLRGINVSGQKKIKMADLRKILENQGFNKVQTYIQSGNVIFKSEVSNASDLEKKIKKGIEDAFNFDVPVLVKTLTELSQILDESPYKNPKDIESNQVYYSILKDKPEIGFKDHLDAKDYPNEEFLITENCAYLNCFKGAGKAKLNNTIIERKLKVTATTRNHRTMLKLLEMASSS